MHSLHFHKHNPLQYYWNSKILQTTYPSKELAELNYENPTTWEMYAAVLRKTQRTRQNFVNWQGTMIKLTKQSVHHHLHLHSRSLFSLKEEGGWQRPAAAHSRATSACRDLPGRRHRRAHRASWRCTRDHSPESPSPVLLPPPDPSQVSSTTVTSAHLIPSQCTTPFV